jgi:hypothetical protein
LPRPGSVIILSVGQGNDEMDLYYGKQKLLRAWDDVVDLIPAAGAALRRSDVTRDRAAELVSGVLWAMNPMFTSIQNATGQAEGSVASRFPADWDEEMAAKVAASVVLTGWDGENVPGFVAGSEVSLVPPGTTANPSELGWEEIAPAVDAFVGYVAKATETDERMFSGYIRHRLLEDIVRYVGMESTFAVPITEEMDAVAPSP